MGEETRKGDDIAYVFWVLVPNVGDGLSDHSHHISWQADSEELGVAQDAQHMQDALTVYPGAASLPENLADQLKEAGLHVGVRKQLLEPEACGERDGHLRGLFLQEALQELVAQSFCLLWLLCWLLNWGMPLLEIVTGPWRSVVPTLLVVISPPGVILVLSLVSSFVTSMPFLVSSSLMRVPAHRPKSLFPLSERSRVAAGPRMPSGMVGGCWVTGLISSSWRYFSIYRT